jgi:hypothetical protein
MAPILCNAARQSDMKLRSMADDSRAERLAAAVEEVHDAVWTELRHIADWWNVSVEELMMATSSDARDDL